MLFLLPWLGHTLVGTTDKPAKIEKNPKVSEEDIQYILRHLDQYFDMPVSRDDVLASWSGLRPLVSDPKASDTAKLSRDHVINHSPSGLITIAGGKWTTYRLMAKDAVDQAVDQAELPQKDSCHTENILIRGAEGYSGQLTQRLGEEFGLEPDVAYHLAKSYGSHAIDIARLAREGHDQRLASNHPYLEAEVLYAMEEELAFNPVDILARANSINLFRFSSGPSGPSPGP